MLANFPTMAISGTVWGKACWPVAMRLRRQMPSGGRSNSPPTWIVTGAKTPMRGSNRYPERGDVPSPPERRRNHLAQLADADLVAVRVAEIGTVEGRHAIARLAFILGAEAFDIGRFAISGRKVRCPALTSAGPRRDQTFVPRSGGAKLWSRRGP